MNRFFVVLFALVLFSSVQHGFSDEHESSSKETEVSHPHNEPASHHPLIENWWSFKNRQEVPPFGYSLINFAVFLLILHQTVGKQLRAFVKSRHDDIRQLIDASEEEKRKEHATLALIEADMRDFPMKRQELFAKMYKSVEMEKTRLSLETQQRIERFKKESQQKIEQRKRKALSEIQAEITGEAIVGAREILTHSLSPSEKQRLMSDPLNRLEQAAKASSLQGGVL